MKKIILSAIVLTIAAGIQAQEIPERKGERPHMQEGRNHHMQKGRKQHGQHMDMQKLNLTEDQKAKFKTQRETFHKQMEDLKKNENITVKEYKTRLENIRKEQKSTADRILTSEQKSQLEKMKADRKGKAEQMGKQRSERMKTELGLTDAQSAKIESNRKEMGEKMKTIRENKSLSDEQKKEQMKELMKKQKENMKSVLTEEQLKKLKDTNHKRPEGERKRPEMKQTI
ncbi:MAG: hypothetical protein IPF69_07105 [Chitinophagaceae bacterium]|jgi:Spy/CpxP family protein refolding chaperone|nr:hypothetical protein [Chitinophagaceae bacterium]MBK7678761.1 hypothetical protein [Chitinophagaceae bacterium]MBK8299893.1 hypothetical protein [Chitinophagaceae bacterium]MBK9463945.1 hypothetical protein [Chitinophagaceae bacterium]MBK9658941.1 hypothetical protein [Chitinophagaceae bacterium]